MARRISVEILGDASSLDRAFKKASHSARGFHHDLGKTTRGALAGSGVFHHVGRSLAFASGGFLASASITEALKSSIDAAVEAAATQRQLATQLQASGLSFDKYRGVIDQATESESALSGFTATELTQAFTTIVRGSGNVSKSLTYTALAADIARGRHISLASASVAVGKAAAGSTTALKRLGIVLPKGATGIEAIALATKKFHGQAQAGATAQQKFAAVLHNSEVIIGSALLPTLTRLLTKGTHWLNQMNRSGHLQRTVAHTAQELGQVLHGVEAVVVPLAHGFRRLSHAVGGTKRTAELLIGVWGAWKVAGLLSKLAMMRKAFVGVAVAEERAALAGGMGGKAGKLAKLGTLAKDAGGLATLGVAGAYAAPIVAAGMFSTQYGKKIGTTMAQGKGVPIYSRGGKHYVVSPRGGEQPYGGQVYGQGAVHVHGDVHVHGVQRPDAFYSHVKKEAKKRGRRGQR